MRNFQCACVCVCVCFCGCVFLWLFASEVVCFCGCLLLWLCVCVFISASTRWPDCVCVRMKVADESVVLHLIGVDCCWCVMGLRVDVCCVFVVSVGW